VRLQDACRGTTACHGILDRGIFGYARTAGAAETTRVVQGVGTSAAIGAGGCTDWAPIGLPHLNDGSQKIRVSDAPISREKVQFERSQSRYERRADRPGRPPRSGKSTRCVSPQFRGRTDRNARGGALPGPGIAEEAIAYRLVCQPHHRDHNDSVAAAELYSCQGGDGGERGEAGEEWAEGEAANGRGGTSADHCLGLEIGYPGNIVA
jgi:hypothetical protein